MADIGGTGNFDPQAKKISGPKSTSKKEAKPSANEVENNHRETHLKKIRHENHGRYLNASDAQKFVPRASRETHLDEFSPELSQEDDDTDLITPFKAKEEKEKALIKNPLLKSKLDLVSKSNKSDLNDHQDHNKSKPPKPSLKSLLAPKGNVDRKMNYEELINLNPQLKKVSSVQIDNMKELVKTIEGEMEHTQKEKTLENKATNKESTSLPLTEIFDFNELFKNFNYKDLQYSLAALSESELEDKVKTQIENTHNALSEDNPLQNFLLLNFPYPFPLYFKELDSEFEDILDELEEENERQEKNQDTYDNESEDENDGDEEDDAEFIPDSVAALSLETYNFGKILALVKYSKDLNKFELSFKGDINGEELAIAINSSIEFTLSADTRIKEKRFRTWKDKAYGHIATNEQRKIQTFIEGEANPVFLKTCCTLVNSILRSDQEISESEKHKGGKML
ncbi:MAG: hypothetical protein VKK32_01235 [Candidatus Melainabacteria bacterium]|nr:hypothetical protein [Candidatus Melainabacteria bacterium]